MGKEREKKHGAGARGAPGGQDTHWWIGKNWQGVAPLLRGSKAAPWGVWERVRGVSAGIQCCERQGLNAPFHQGWKVVCMCVCCGCKRESYVYMNECLFVCHSAAGFLIDELACCVLVHQLDCPPIAHQRILRGLSAFQHIANHISIKKVIQKQQSNQRHFFFFQWAPAGISLLISLWELVEIRSECLRPLCALLSTSQNGYSMNVSQNTNYVMIYIMCSVKQSATHLHTS